MTIRDSLARIRAERDADRALAAGHPDPLTLNWKLQARAADRCARKRALLAPYARLMREP